MSTPDSYESIRAGWLNMVARRPVGSEPDWWGFAMTWWIDEDQGIDEPDTWDPLEVCA